MLATNIELPKGNQPWLVVDPGTCEHENGFTNSVCNDCGWECTKHRWSNGYCECCGYECEHDEFEDGYCMDCGEYIGDCVDLDAAYDAWKERD